jgi:FtsP/CotA-like multicopper oxidase with cupredoxin domain
VQLNKKAKNYAIRAASVSDAQIIDGFAVLSYKSHDNPGYNVNAGKLSSTPFVNRAGKPSAGNITYFNQSKMVSFPAQFPQPAPQPAQTFILDLTTVGASYIWALNSTALNNTFIDNLDVPLLFQDPSKFNSQNVTIKTLNNTWVDLIFSAQTFPQPIHPIHKHSNKGFQIGQGTGPFPWKSVAEAAAALPANFNLVNPPYRDGFTTAPTIDKGAWTVMRYHVVNPGAFIIHCHIQSHFEGGMSMVILDGVDAWPRYGDYKGFEETLEG